MRFRWVALLTLWTILSGPILAFQEKTTRSETTPTTSPILQTPPKLQKQE